MRKLTISVAKNYTDKNTNAVKTKWITVGSLIIQDDGKNLNTDTLSKHLYWN